jgi:hypothetical protein
MIIFSDSKDIYYLRNYHPLKWQGEENDCFDYFSEKILGCISVLQIPEKIAKMKKLVKP